MIKVDIISGFLGAGKTTLIKRLFESKIKEERKVLIENEFGEISVDGSFLKDSGVEIKEINAGCICCSLVGDFAKSIQEVVTKFNPERIIIEPSGVGKLSDIVKAIQNTGIQELKINMLVTVVDGLKAKVYMKNFGEFFLDQIDYANTIIVSKLDKAKDNKDDVIALIKERNSNANVITTSVNEINPDTLLAFLEEKSSLYNNFVEEAMKETHEHHHHHDDDEECCCHHEHEHHHDEEEECCCHEHGHHHDDDEECCCHHEHEHHHDEECCCHHEHEHEHHHHHHADEVFTSWGKETTMPISYDELNNFLNTLANADDLGIIVRSKGVLKAKDNAKWYYFDFVSGDYEIRLGEPDFTGKIVVIGSKINEEKIESLFFNK